MNFGNSQFQPERCVGQYRSIQPVNVTRASLRTTCSWPHDIDANDVPLSNAMDSRRFEWDFLNKKSGRSLLWKLCHRTTELRLRKAKNVCKNKNITFESSLFGQWSNANLRWFIFSAKIPVTIWFDACRASRSKTTTFQRVFVFLWFLAQIQWSATWYFWALEVIAGHCSQSVLFARLSKHLMTFGIRQCADIFNFTAFLQKSLCSRWPFLRNSNAESATRFLACIAAIRRWFIARFHANTVSNVHRTGDIRPKCSMPWRTIMMRTQVIRTHSAAGIIYWRFQFIIVHRQQFISWNEAWIRCRSHWRWRRWHCNDVDALHIRHFLANMCDIE